MKTFTLRLKEDQIDTILLALRYLELNHPTKGDNPETMFANYRPDFKNLLNQIYLQVHQTSLFQEE